ncbi:putative low-complexity protein [Rubidibacter lacunae KORDI 51-2]|uniref:Putative low-complexity protein n=1 Tax=Rubidibacter lacunae KORDI 51-2 TaxID=582515 RepID=U5DQI2_9CHRO|nr:pentapeptide repeat-containing protein [Rubidibacter lacunae]ERN43082.1 putative low-complexity protein [Rubidibacter lacunae KORDI 51-2]
MANRTNAKDVLRRYATGDRDFRDLSLRGQSFKNADLSGADFTEADIRGTNFSEATLCGTNFTKAKVGLQRRWVVGVLAIVFALSALASFLSHIVILLVSYSVALLVQIPVSLELSSLRLSLALDRYLPYTPTLSLELSL